MIDHTDFRTQLFCFHQVVRGEKDRDPFACNQQGKILPQCSGGDRVQAGGRLVEEDQLRAVHERAGDGQLLLHAAAPASDGFLAAVI